LPASVAGVLAATRRSKHARRRQAESASLSEAVLRMIFRSSCDLSSLSADAPRATSSYRRGTTS
jgi:hypothetical protein